MMGNPTRVSRNPTAQNYLGPWALDVDSGLTLPQKTPYNYNPSYPETLF